MLQPHNSLTTIAIVFGIVAIVALFLGYRVSINLSDSSIISVY